MHFGFLEAEPGSDPFERTGRRDARVRSMGPIRTEISIAFLFPGQGAQLPGLLHTLPEHPAIARTLDEVSEGLQQNVLGTRYRRPCGQRCPSSWPCKPRAWLWRAASTKKASSPSWFAGLSAGSFCAAVAAGVVNLAVAVRLVKQHVEMTARLYQRGYGVAVIVGLNETQVSNLVEQVRSATAAVYISDINAPRQIVIAGSDEGIDKVLENARKSGARKAEPRDLAEPSHCPLLAPG
jgi:malonate decarboxylase epsilon subunit